MKLMEIDREVELIMMILMMHVYWNYIYLDLLAIGDQLLYDHDHAWADISDPCS